MKILLILVSSAALFAQSFPSSIYTPLVAKDNVSTTLTSPMSAGDAVAIVASSAGWVPNMAAYLCEATTGTGALAKCSSYEVMLVTSVATNVLNVTRGYGGSSAIAHAKGKTLSNSPSAVYTNSAQIELAAIESTLGVNLANLPNSASFTNVSTYAFTPIVSGSGVTVSGGNLIIGNNTLTFATVPKGVNGTDVAHFLYVSGGTGTAGPCLISGGGGIAGAVNGQIILNCPATHSGAWSVGTATGYIQEAIAATASGGVVYAAPGTYALNAAVQVPSNLSLNGAGQGATTLQVANSALATNAAWQIQGKPGQYCIVCLAPLGQFQRVRDLTVDANGVNQTYFYYTDVYGINVSNAIFERVTVKNHAIAGGTGVMFGFVQDPGTSLSLNRNNTIISSSSFGIPGCTVPNGGGAYYIEGYGTRIISSYAQDFCDSAYVLNVCDHCLVADSVADVGSGQMSTPTFSIEGATNSTFQNDQCIATGTNGHRYCVGIAGVPTWHSTGNMVIGVSSSHASNALEIGANNIGFGETTPVSNTQVIGLHADNNALDCIVLSEYVNKVTISGGDLTGCGSAGIYIGSTGAIAGGKVVQNVSIDGVKIDHAVYAAIGAGNGTAGPPVAGIKITNSFLGDTSGTPVQPRGIIFTSGLISDAVIAGNTMLGNTVAATLYQNTWGANVILGPNITSAGDPDYGTYPIWNWASGNGRGRMQSFSDTHDYSVLSENYRHTTASTGTVDNASTGTAEVSVIGLNGASGAVQLKAGGVNTAPIPIWNCQTGGCTPVVYTFASLPPAGGTSPPAAGTLVYCANCTTAATCAAGGTGHMAVYNSTAWTCN